QLDVEQHDVGVELAGDAERLAPVGGLADHVEALGLEQPARYAAEARVVVDDDDRGHVRMLAEPPRDRRTGTHTLASRGKRRLVDAPFLARDAGCSRRWPARRP